MDLLFRVACNSGSDEPLNMHLKRITDSAYTRKTLGGNAIDGESVAPVIQESHDAECRQEIMQHVRSCLSEPGRRWQRIYGGLTLTEILLQHGADELAIEVAHGHHFDLVQKVSLLEHFDGAARGVSDRRATSIVRSKASELKAMIIPLLTKASNEELPENAGLNAKGDHGIFRDSASQSTAAGSGPPTSSASPLSSVPTPAAGDGKGAADTEPKTPDAVSRARLDSRMTPQPLIDDAFSSLRDWVDAGPGSAAPTPKHAAYEESDTEPLGEMPDMFNLRGRNRTLSASSVGSDAFFTPMISPAVALTPEREGHLGSNGTNDMASARLSL